MAGQRAGLLALVAAVAGVLVWARSLELEWSDVRLPRWRRERVAAARAASVDDENEDEPLTLTRRPVEQPADRIGEPRPVAEPSPRPAPVIADRQLAPSAARTKPAQAKLDLVVQFWAYSWSLLDGRASLRE